MTHLRFYTSECLPWCLVPQNPVRTLVLDLDCCIASFYPQKHWQVLVYFTEFDEPEPLGSKFVELKKNVSSFGFDEPQSRTFFSVVVILLFSFVICLQLSILTLRVPRSILLSPDSTLSELPRELQLFPLCQRVF